MLAVGILLVYLVMVAQFQDLKSPFIVMFTIPLAFTGGFLALLIAGLEINLLSMLGMIMLVGIIVNNGIVLVDYINQLRIGGMDRREAIADAAVTRLRPILMTSITTILGLIVMALGQSEATSLIQPARRNVHRRAAVRHAHDALRRARHVRRALQKGALPRGRGRSSAQRKINPCLGTPCS